ncbi:MAG: DNA double-strand break repair nuclease NurA [Candidatus Marinimicrobia bacterium]|nr:DNA double-strand break repair nuclease NurA [Candidatus Neomarinimicrobiota bacterium]
MKKPKDKTPLKSALIVNPNWNKTIGELKKKRVLFISEPVEGKTNISLPPDDGKKIQILEKDSISHDLNAHNGKDVALSYQLEAYDESYYKYAALSGAAYFTCHTLVRLDSDDYVSMCELTANYITRSEEVVGDSEVFSLASADSSTGAKFNENYSEERKNFLKTNVSDNTILIIDGPLIGNQLSSRTIRLVKDLKERNVATFFVTKNSDSMLLSNEIAPKKYHSDLDWASKNLPSGHRSSFIKYKDLNAGHTEIFCYLKTYAYASPLRISFYPTIYNENKDLVKEVMDMLYFLILDDGNQNNPQVRLIRIAELFAKDIIKIANPDRQVRMSGLIPTVNQSRFGRSL